MQRLNNDNNQRFHDWHAKACMPYNQHDQFLRNLTLAIFSVMDSIKKNNFCLEAEMRDHSVGANVFYDYSIEIVYSKSLS